MQDPNFINPLTNPIFSQVMTRLFLTFLAGFLLIFILNKFSLKDIWKKNVGKRYLSWLVFGSIYIAGISFGGYTALCFLLMIILVALVEVNKIAKLPKIYHACLIFLSIISVYVVSFQQEFFYSLPLLYFIVLTFATIRENNPKGLFNFSFTLFVCIWIIFSLCHFVLLGHLNNTLDSTKALLFLVGFAVALSDIGAYVVGRAFAKTKLDKYKIADKISPNKTYAGMLGNILGAALGVIIMHFAISNYFSLTELIILPILIGVFGIVGDLTESQFKRHFKAKDSGEILPGHGGILDRIDSTLRVIIIVFYFSLFVI